MYFTYDGYRSLLLLLKEHGYNFCGYGDNNLCDFCVILRHDVDISLESALQISRVENEFKRVCNSIKSTFFFLLSGELYNLFTNKSKRILDEILSHGNEIGLHFNPMRYDGKDLVAKILFEVDVLSKITGRTIKVVSFHNPSKEILDSNMDIPGVINAYSSHYFKEFKYVSDSNWRWREPVEDYIKQKKYPMMQILTHPFTYDNKEKSCREKILTFINSANRERYDVFNGMMFNFSEIIKENEIR